MRPAMVIGIILIILGIAAFGYQGVMWVRGQEQVAQVGPVQVTREKDFPIPLAPVIGTVLIVGGILLTMAGTRRPVSA